MKPFLRELTLESFLSFGPEANSLECKGLNLLIGPNASGKSNLLEAIGLLASCPRDLSDVVRSGGGVQEWLWKGKSPPAPARLEVVLDGDHLRPLRYALQFAPAGQRMEVVDEILEDAEALPGEESPYSYYRFQHGRPVLSLKEQGSGIQHTTHRRRLQVEDIDVQQSILAQRSDPEAYPELTYVGRRFKAIKLYREWNFGRSTAPRMPHLADLPEDFLLEDASNLGMVLSDLNHRPAARLLLLEYLQKFYEEVESFSVKPSGGTVQIYIHERGPGRPIIPATRLSDGTLRYLCLLAILLHPQPPPVICIEEPEIGLHPDMLSSVAELLRYASKRTQLFVATHSETLVSAFTDTPESVVVCERLKGVTTACRLDSGQLKEWLDRYTLGELWTKGELGGTRW